MCILWAHKRHSKVVLRQHWQWHSPTVRSHCQLCIKSLMCTKSIRTSLNILTSWFGWLGFNYKTLHERRSESISRYWHCSQQFPYLMSVEQINRYLYLELLMIPPAHARFAWPQILGISIIRACGCLWWDHQPTTHQPHQSSLHCLWYELLIALITLCTERQLPRNRSQNHNSITFWRRPAPHSQRHQICMPLAVMPDLWLYLGNFSSNIWHHWPQFRPMKLRNYVTNLTNLVSLHYEQ